MTKGKSTRSKKRLTQDSVISQSDINQQIKAIKAKSKALLIKANLDIKSVRKDVAALKKAGIVSKRIDARRYQPSAYMLKKIRANADIIKGEAIPVKAPKDIRDKYRNAGTFEVRGGSIIVPKDRKQQTAKIRRGLIETRTPLKNGEEIKIILPFKGKDLKDIAEQLADDETLGGLKDPLELFGARIFGHNIAGGFGFPDADELGNYILQNYNHLFSGKNKSAALRNFELVRFIADDSMMQPSVGVIDDEYRNRNKQGNQWAIDRRKKRAAMRKATAREKETDAQREQRLTAQRARSRRNREQRKGK